MGSSFAGGRYGDAGSGIGEDKRRDNAPAASVDKLIWGAPKGATAELPWAYLRFGRLSARRKSTAARYPRQPSGSRGRVSASLLGPHSTKITESQKARSTHLGKLAPTHSSQTPLCPLHKGHAWACPHLMLLWTSIRKNICACLKQNCDRNS